MDRLWAPWRKAYIRPDKKNSGKACLFCLFAKTPSRDASQYVIKRTSLNFAVLNLYPYNNGHVMIIPCRHIDSIDKMTDREKVDWLNLTEEVRVALQKTMKPHGFNLGINMGRAAGAGIPKHLHLHIVPRWKGDVNFMPLIGEVKVISESLDSAYKILAKEMKKRPAGRR